MRTKTIIEGFKNSQKFRFILKANSGEEVGLTMSIQQMSDTFATRDARVAVWEALLKLALQRRLAKSKGEQMPLGLVNDATRQGFRQVQVDLH
jgi:hypothetical protein